MSEEQNISLLDRYTAKAKKNTLNGVRSFRLNSQQCEKYLRVNNSTFHSPSCYVQDILRDGKSAKIKAIFFGSGIASHPVRYGTVPISEIEPNLSIGELLTIRFIGWIKSSFRR